MRDKKIIEINKKSIILIIIAILIFTLNSAFTTNFNIMLILTTLQVIFLFVLFIKGNDMDFLCYYIIFTAASMEYGEFLGTELFYGIKNFKIVGINLAIWLIVPLFFKHLVLNYIFLFFKKNNSYVKKVSISMIILTLLGTFVGLSSILINDNNTGQIQGVLSYFLNESYIFFFSLICILTIVSVVEKNDNNTEKLKITILAIFVGLQASILYSILSGTYGNYGGINTLRVSNIVMLIPLSLLIPFYKVFSKKINIIFLFLGSLTVLLALYFNSNGKILLLMMLVPIIVIFLIFYKGKKLSVSALMITLPIFITGILFLVNNFTETSRLLTLKIEQTLSLISIWNNDWFETMNASPRARIAEFLNIGIEYYEKPYFFLTGKGYLGTIPDHLNMFISWSLTGFSSLEWSMGVFYQMHETLNTIFLTNGLIGLLIFGYIAKLLIFKFQTSVFLLIGSIWFLLFYGYSITLAVFGIVSLIVGLYDLDKNFQEKISSKTRKKFRRKTIARSSS